VKSRFTGILRECCAALDAAAEWQAFNGEFMQPLIQEIGARTYQLISGSALDIERTAHFRVYLSKYSPENQQGLRAAIVKFLDPRDADVRSFVLRHLSAYFCVESGNLRAETVDSLIRMVEHPPSFKIFVDTNFLFSFLELHENPSNEAAKSLVTLTKQLEGKTPCKFYVSPETVDEFKRVVEAQRDFLRGLTLPRNLAEAALEIDLSGVARKFVEFSAVAGQPLTADTYFEPYLSDLIPTLRYKDVTFFNDSMKQYSVRQDVIDDILEQLAYGKKRFGPRAKSYAQLKHDVVLWHFVSDKRPARVESPIEATFWIVTIDYHYLGFDEFKRSKTDGLIPVCLHPTSLIQMLQFWLPRTQEFEEAILDSLRLPLLFQEFDSSAEKVTVRILETLARFENADQLPKEVVGNILVNRALRQELALEPDRQKQVDLITGALVEENQRVQSELRASSEEIGRLASELDQSRNEIGQLKEQLTILPAANATMMTGTEPIIGSPTDKRIELHRKYQITYFVTASALSLALFVAVSGIGLMVLRPTFGIARTGVVIWCAGLLVWAMLVNRIGEKNEALRSWGIFEQFARHRKELFGVIIFAIIWDSFEFVKTMALELFNKLFK
jgi:hypothetical protein